MVTVPGTARVGLAVVRLLAAAQARRTSAVPGTVTNHDYEAHMSGQILFYHDNRRKQYTFYLRKRHGNADIVVEIANLINM